ncbi:hypothetical protein [Salinispora arenicola]|uniref:hypothetical protein n=1 Tax=Salinispora arenicola TaxID=168697 RepID=UPI0016AC03F3|nr:hypothetical protein [Salinispora arenicola]NIL64775.1 hypothetical protein [Salinispora arenicola]
MDSAILMTSFHDFFAVSREELIPKTSGAASMNIQYSVRMRQNTLLPFWRGDADQDDTESRGAVG